MRLTLGQLKRIIKEAIIKEQCEKIGGTQVLVFTYNGKIRGVFSSEAEAKTEVQKVRSSLKGIDMKKEMFDSWIVDGPQKKIEDGLPQNDSSLCDNDGKQVWVLSDNSGKIHGVFSSIEYAMKKEKEKGIELHIDKWSVNYPPQKKIDSSLISGIDPDASDTSPSRYNW